MSWPEWSGPSGRWAGIGDQAQDLSAAWSVLEGAARQAFKEAAGVDDATWLRARAFELEHAVGGILYYRPRNHPLADVMERTLSHILAEPVERGAPERHES